MRLGFALLFASMLLIQSGGDGWRSDDGVLALKRSAHAVLKDVPVRAVRMGEGFWASRRRANLERSIPTLLELLEQNGIVDNFRRLSGRKQAPRRGPLYTDSDLYKWMEAVGFVLQSGPNPALRATMDRLVDDVLAAQEPSGYLSPPTSKDASPFASRNSSAPTKSTVGVTCCRPASRTTVPPAIAACSMAGSAWPITSSQTSARTSGRC